MRSGTITLRIDSQLENVFLVGAAIHRICTAMRLGEQAAYEVEVSAVEAVNNAITHAYEGERGHAVEVVVTVAGDRMIVDVCDTGRPIQRLRCELPPVDEAHYENLAEGGRGLFIMHAFSDALAYERIGERNVLTLVKMLPTHTVSQRGDRGSRAVRAAAASANVGKTG
jgi:serine/threonine-protein kinase RsbW